MSKELRVPVIELFNGCQGEAKSLGIPSIFIRFWGCNLRCQFESKQCDTPYAVITERNKAKMYTVDELVNETIKLTNNNDNIEIKNIVISGGEPTMYQNFLLQYLIELKRIKPYITIEIETNGTKPLLRAVEINSKFYDINDYIDQYNVSVKLKNSNQENTKYDKLRINKNALNTFPRNKSYFKFVVTHEQDVINEVIPLVNEYKFKTYLMPQGLTNKEVNNNGRNVVNWCIKYGFIYSPREHINLYGKLRGV